MREGDSMCGVGVFWVDVVFVVAVDRSHVGKGLGFSGVLGGKRGASFVRSEVGVCGVCGSR
jgi:hypothetical protein